MRILLTYRQKSLLLGQMAGERELEMGETTKTRAPQQKRSIDKKNKIVEAAFKVFCDKGYYRTTTIEVAKAAGVSVGCLYSYFKDKYELFTVILDRYDQEFDSVRERALRPAGGPTLRTYSEMVRGLIEALLEEHEVSREMNREIKVLSYSDPAIAARIERQGEKIHESVLAELSARRDDLRPSDLEAAALIVWKIISAVVETMAFEPQKIERKRVIDAAVDAICTYLFK